MKNKLEKCNTIVYRYIEIFQLKRAVIVKVSYVVCAPYSHYGCASRDDDKFSKII